MIQLIFSTIASPRILHMMRNVFLNSLNSGLVDLLTGYVSISKEIGNFDQSLRCKLGSVLAEIVKMKNIRYKFNRGTKMKVHWEYRANI